ncbi:TolC family protein [Sphingobacterium deserti]|uniref:Outer membrane efflux protein n=1 Tax=Sphingobacterium deserti TaxID=1229276 RepID=A0A0B8T523_9SPHI|nr:TolC family protein [Sphingobacterium deserti]KGE15443.1 outer membrane efflux protein [Sphingobacterium deserti]
MKNNLRYIVFLWICVFSSDAALGQSESKMSLATCVSIAIKNNPGLRRSELELARNEVNYRQARYNRLPTLNGNISHNYSEGRSINSTTNQFVDNNLFIGAQSLSLSMPVFNGFRVLHDIRSKASARQAGKFEFESAINELRLDVIEAYIFVLTSRDMLEQAQNQLAVTEESLHRASVMQREGAINPGDFYDIEGQASTERNILETTKQDLYTSEARLAGLMYISPDELPELEPLPLPSEATSLSNAALYEQALLVLPDFKGFKNRIDEAEHNVKVAKSAFYPSLSLNANIQAPYSSVDAMGYNYWQQIRNYPSKGIGLTLQIPIFNQMVVRSQVKLARIDLEQARWNKKVQENLVREETAKTVFNLSTLKQNVGNLKKQERSYEEAFRIAQVHFDAGNSNSVLFLTAKTKLDNARNQLLIKQYEWLFQKYINDYYSGLLEL